MQYLFRLSAENKGTGCQLVIEHVSTVDLPDNQPCPPFYDGFVWRVVRRDGGRTLWRKIFLSTSPVTPGAASPGDHSRARQRKGP